MKITAPVIAPETALFAPAGAIFKMVPFLNLLILWAQQDLNLRPTDYESAALTV